jgi:cell division protein FtsI (penicillin-binding protein 3)
MKLRVVIFVISLLTCLGAIVARLTYVQLLPNSDLEHLKKSQYMTIVQIPPQRGKILDRRGEELATSINSQSLYADASLITSPRKVSKKLAALLDLKEKDLFNILNSDRKFVWLKRQLDSDLVSEIKSWEEPGLKFVEEGKRAYPNQTLLSQILGFIGTEGGGLEGLEKKYDGELKGEKQSIPSRRDARGRPLVVSGQLFEYQGDGATLETTVDKDLQYELEHELENVTTTQMADKATGVVMDPITGEILAMGSYPTFDPIRAGKANPEYRRNRAVTDIYEPGSTFKVVTVAAALRSGKIQPNTKFFCENGKFKIGKRVIHEAETTHGFGWLSLAEILQVSSNIGTSKVALSIGQDAFRTMITEMGFGSKTGIDFPGEASGIIDSGRWNDHLLSNVSFGHGIGVTAIQMANIYSAIANGGRLMRPYIVKTIRDADGRVVEERTPEIKKQVLNPKESSLITMMLSGVTEEGGTGTLARVDGYPVAGKTGTAQKVNPNGRGYLSKSYVSSFIGFVPANNPQFTIYIVVDNPRKQFMGAQVAAPSFNHIASFALHQRGFMPIVVTEQQKVLAKATVEPPLEKPNWMPAETHDQVPDFSGLTVREVSQLLEKYGVANKSQVELLGSGIAEAQNPPAGQPWGKKLRVVFKSPE